MLRRWQTQKGFTIVELLIVIVVIGILAAITIVAYGTIQNRAKDTQTDSNLSQVKRLLEMYRSDNGVYPAVCSGGDGAGCSANFLAAELVPTYANRAPDMYSNAYGIYQYVRDAGGQGYGLYMRYYSKSHCKTGVDIETGWWGAGLATC